MAVDREQMDREQKESWARAAANWGRRQLDMQERNAVVSRAMVDAVDPRPGERLLELAAGPGETGFEAAARVGPDGSLLSTDQASEMVDVARARAAELGLQNVEFGALDAQKMDLEDNAFDAVLCRFGYMLMTDRAAALSETRRVLRPGGRLALAVWDRPDRNMWLAAPVMQLAARGLISPPSPGTPTPFAMADRDLVASELEQAGFTDVDVQRLEYAGDYPDFDYYWTLTLDLAAPVRDALDKTDEAGAAEVREAVREVLAEYRDDGEALRIPASVLMASARA